MSIEESKPMVESQPLLKEIAANPRKAIELLKEGAKLEMIFFHGSRYIYIMPNPNRLRGQLFPTNVFNALRELQLIKEEKENIFIYNE